MRCRVAVQRDRLRRALLAFDRFAKERLGGRDIALGAQPEVDRPARAVGLGMLYTAYYVAMAVGPGLAGFLRDQFRTAEAALVFGGILFGLCVLLLGSFHVVVHQNRALASNR